MLDHARRISRYPFIGKAELEKRFDRAHILGGRLRRDFPIAFEPVAFIVIAALRPLAAMFAANAATKPPAISRTRRDIPDGRVETGVPKDHLAAKNPLVQYGPSALAIVAGLAASQLTIRRLR